MIRPVLVATTVRLLAQHASPLYYYLSLLRVVHNLLPSSACDAMPLRCNGEFGISPALTQLRALRYFKSTWATASRLAVAGRSMTKRFFEQREKNGERIDDREGVCQTVEIEEHHCLPKESRYWLREICMCRW